MKTYNWRKTLTTLAIAMMGVGVFGQPVWVPGTPAVSGTGPISIGVNYGINMTGTVYIIVINFDFVTPLTSADIKTASIAGPSGGRVATAVLSVNAGNVNLVLNRLFEGLQANRTHSLFLVAESSGGVLQASPTKLLTSTLPCTPIKVQTFFGNSGECVNLGAQGVYAAAPIPFTPTGILKGTQWTIDWGDGSPVFNYISTADNDIPVVPPHLFTSITNCNYVGTWTIQNPCGQFLNGSSVFVVHGRDIPADGDGELLIVDHATGTPNILYLCEGQEYNVTLRDASTWNCQNPTVPPPLTAKPNNDPRTLQWTYGRTPAGAIMNTISGNVVVGGSHITNSGTGYVGAVIPNVTAVGQLSEVITIPATSVVGQRYYVYLKNWNKCNPYTNENLNYEYEEFIIEIIDAPNPPIVVSPQNYCFGSVPLSISATPNTAGNTLNWYADQAKTSYLGTGLSYNHGRTATGSYDFWVAERSLSNSCEGPAAKLTLVIREELGTPGPVTGPAEVCINANNVNFSVTADPAVEPLGGATEYVWTVPAGWTITAGQGTKQITVNIGGTAGARTVSLVRRYTTLPNCPSPARNHAVTVSPLSVGGAVTGGTTPLCIGSATGNMTLSGHTGSVVRWERRLGAGAWTNIANTTATYSETPASAGNWEYRALVQSGSCSQSYSSVRTIVVDPVSVGGSISGGSTPICFGSSTGVMTLSGHTGSIVRWERRVNSGGWVNIANTNTTYSETPSSAGTWDYRARIQSGACAAVYSTIRTIVVDPTSVGGSVSGGSTPVCLGSSTGVMTLSGHTGIIIRWQRRLDGGGWVNIVNNTTSYSEVPASIGTWEYRAQVQSGSCASTFSSPRAIVVTPASVGGSITGGTSPICIGSGTGTMTLSGYTGSITRWERRLNAGAWSNIANTTTTHSETPASAGTWEYRALVTSGACPGVYSTSQTIVVDPATVGGSITGATSPICLGSSTGLMTLSGHTGSILQWEVRVNAGGWAIIPNINPTYTHTPPSAGTWEYRALLRSGSCATAYSAVQTVIVNPPSVGGSVTGGTTPLCYNVNTGVMSLSGHTGSVLRWERRLNAGAWQNIGNTNTTYSEVPVSNGTWDYRAVVQSGVCPPANSAVRTIVVNPQFSLAQLRKDTSICINASADFNIQLTGGTGPYTIAYNRNGTPQANLTNYASGTNVNSGSLTVTTTYALTSATDNLGCPAESLGTPIVVTVGSSPVSASLTGSGDACSGTSSTIRSVITGGAPPYTLAITGYGPANNYISGNNIPLGALAVGPHTYTLTSVTDACGNSVPAGGLPGPYTININPIPSAAGTLNNAPLICHNTLTNILLNADVPGTTLNWTVTDPNAAGALPGSGSSGNTIAQTLTNTSNAVKTATYNITPTGPAPTNCAGGTINRAVQVEPKPVLVANSTVPALCTGGNVNIALSSPTVPTIPVNLRWNVAVSSTNPGATGGTAYTSLNAQAFPASITGTLTNSSNADITVTFTFTPTYTGCANGDNVVVNVTVRPEPILADLTTTICSDVASGLNLSVAGGSVAAANYNITAINNNGLTASAGAPATGNGLAANVIANDAWTNTGLNPVNVIYTVRPVSAASCTGPSKDVSLTINPEPVMNALSNTVCSDATSGITLSSVAGSVAAATYNITGINANGLTASAGAPVTGTGFTANEILNDAWTNTTGANVNVVYTVVPVSAAGCSGNSQTVTITVRPEPTLANLSATICSDVTTGLNLSVAGGSVAAATYNITNINANGLTASAGAPATGTGFAANVIANDAWTNTTNANVNVVYTVVPVSANLCEGNPRDVTITVRPEPVLADLSATTCSDVAGGLNLSVAVGSVAAANYNITAINQNGLIASAGSPATGNGLLSSVIADDAFTNTSTNPVNVIYTVRPVSANACVGDSKAVTMTINPEPVLSVLTNTVCSDAPSGITLSTTVGSVAANSYNITNINPNGLTASAGSPNTGNGFAATEILDDAWTNTTGANVNVVYTVVPVSAAGCSGNPQTVTLTVRPEPILANLSATVCSDVVSGLNLSVAGGSVAAASYRITAINNGGLTASAGAPATGSGFAANVIANDAWTNTSSANVNVVYTVIPVSANLCEGNPRDVTLTIKPEPVISNQSASLCSGNSLDHQILLDNFTNPGDNVTFTWPLPVMDPGLSGGTARVAPSSANIMDTYTNITGLARNSTYTITPYYNGCTGNSRTLVVTVGSEPVMDPNLSKSVCSGLDIDLVLKEDVGSVVPTGYNILLMTVQAGLVANGANNPAPVNGVGPSYLQNHKFLNETGSNRTVTYRVQPYFGASCIGSPVDIVITIRPQPVILPGQMKTVCSGTPVNREIILVPANTPAGTRFNWGLPAMSDGTTQGTAGTNVAADPAGTFHLTDVLSNTSILPITATYNISPVSSFGCAGTSVPVVITVNPEPAAPVVTGRDKLCTGETNIVYSVPSSPGSSYTWTVPAAVGTKIFDFNTNAIIINASAVAGSGSITIRETNSYNCTGPTGSFAVQIYAPAVVSNITGPASVCAGSQHTYRVPFNAGSVYNWLVPAGAAIIGNPTSDSIDILYGIVGGNITVRETNAAGCVTNHNPLAVTVNALPNATITAPKTNICVGESLTFTAGPPAQANYEFFVNGGSVQSGPSNTYTSNSLVNGDQVYVNVTTAAGCQKTSTILTINVFDNPVPVLSSSDADNIICNGTSVTFTVNAPGATNYQFFRNSASVQNGALSIYTTSSLADKDTIRVIATTSMGCTGTSNAIVTTVNPLPVAVISGDATICPGSSTNLQISVSTGTSPYSVRVDQGVGTINNYISNSPIPVAPLTSTVYRIEQVVDANGCSVTAPIANLTGTATVNLLTNVGIVTQPHNAIVCENTDTSFTIVAVGSGRTIQWQADTGGGFANLSDIPGVYTGTNSASLKVLNPSPAQNGILYRAIVNGTCAGPVISDVVNLTVYTKPLVSLQPVNVTECEDGNVYFAAAAGTTTNPAFQWQTFNGSSWINLNNGAPYSGVNNDTLFLSGISSPLHNRQYRAVITGTCAPSVNTNAAVLSVNEKPEITLQPVNETRCEGQSVSFSINTGVTTNPVIQWEVFNGTLWTPISGAPYSNWNTPVLTVNPVTSSMNAYRFRAVVNGTCAPPVTSGEATLTINELPEIISQPLSVIACEDDTVFFEINPGVTTNPSIQWQLSSNGGVSWGAVSGVRFSGTSTNRLTINGITSAMHNYQFRALVSGTCAPVATSNAAILTVREKPEVTLQPVNAVECEDGNVSFTISTGVTTSPVIQWEVFDGAAWSNASGGIYTGDQTSTLNLTGISSIMNNYRYRASVSGICAPSVLSNEAFLTVREKPEVSVHPKDTAVCENTNAVFTVGTGVTTSPSVQWQVSINGGGSWNNVSGPGYSGGNTTVLNVLNTSSSMHNYQYRAVISGTCAPAVNSNPAVLTILESPEITVQPAPQIVCEDGNTSYTVNAGVTTNPAYVWEVNEGFAWFTASGAVYSGQGTNSLNITGANSGMNNFRYRVRVSGTCAPPVTSNEALLTVEEKPEIALQPVSVTICENDNTSFTVNPGVTTSPSYNWEVFNGSAWSNATGGIYAGGNSATLNLTNVPSSMNGYQYRVTISGNCAPPVVSVAAVLTVRERPEITGQPVNAAACEGDSVFFAVNPGVTTQPSYQWQRFTGSNWVPVSGVIYSGGADTLFVNGIGSSLNGTRYRVIVGGVCSAPVTSGEAALTVYERPEVTLQPNDAVQCEGQSVSFTISTGVTTSPVVQWQFFDGSVWANASGVPYSGENTNTLTVNPVSTALNGFRFRALVNGTCGPQAVSNEAGLTVRELPEVTLQPVDVIACEGETVTFTTDPGVTTNPVIQWQVSADNGVSWANVAGAPYSGSNSTTLTINGIISSQNQYRYRAVISGTCAPAVNSASALLTVREKPEVTLQPVNVSTCEGTNAVFTINTGVTTNPVIQWEVWNGTAWSNATGAGYMGDNTSSLTVIAVNSGMNNYRYRALVSGICTPPVYSSEASLTVLEVPEITTQPSDTAVCEGLNASFRVMAGVTSSPSYEWFVSTDGGGSWNAAAGAGYSGVDQAILNVLGTTTAQDGWQFRARVSGICPGPVNSNAVVLTIYEKPEITVQPVNDTVCENGTAVFTVDATPTTSPVYYWEVNDGGSWFAANGLKYSGQGTPTLTVTNATSDMSGYQYRVTISGTCAPPVVSSQARLVVKEKPEVTANPSSVEICENSNTSFTVNAGVTTNPQYSWEFYNGSVWASATGGIYSGSATATLSLTSVPSSHNNFRYRAVISGDCAPSATSGEAVLTVNERPEITDDPDPITACEGDTVSFTISSGVTTAPVVKWQVFNGSTWSVITGGVYTGFSTNTLVVNGITSAMNNYSYRAIVSGTCSPNDTSAIAILTVREKPEIITQPVSSTICEGAGTSFTVNAGVTTNPAYQWQVDAGTGSFVNVALPGHSGTTTANLVIASGTSAMNGYKYRVRVSGACTPEEISNVVNLTIEETPEISLQPRDTTVCRGANVTFRVGAGVTSNPAYQWQYFNGVIWQNTPAVGNYTGSTSPVLTVYNVDSAMTGYRFKALVSGTCVPPVESSEAVLTVFTAPVITLNPVDRTVCEGLPAIFLADAVGTGLSYQWQVDRRDGFGFVDFADQPGVYSGTATKTLTVLAPPRTFNTYRYRARVEGTCTPAAVTSFATLNINTAPEIQVQPVSRTICEFGNVSFSVSMSGAGLGYIWQESSGGPFQDLQDTGSYIGTATNTMSIFNVPRASSGNRYRVIVTGGCNPPASSDVAVLTIETAPVITVQPVDRVVCQNNSTSFAVTAEGSNLAYKWQLSTGGPFSDIIDDATYSGTNSSLLAISNATPAMNGYRYRLRVSGSCPSPVFSEAAMLTVNLNPTVTINPSNAEICQNGSASFLGGATGTGISFRWQVNSGSGWQDLSDGVNYSGTATQTLNIVNAPVLFNGNRYRLSVIGACLPDYTGEATLVVNPNPAANITGDGTFPLVCGGSDLNLNANPTGGTGSYSHSWTGDVTPLNSFNTATTVFNTIIHGTYNLNYTVTDGKGCKTSVSATIENDIPNAQFTSDATPSCGFRVVNFNNASTRAVSYEWNFDDGSAVETNLNASHGFDNFEPSGLVKYYNVKLVATSANNCRDTANQIITIYPKVDPTFEVTPNTACTPVEALLVTQPGAASYQWDFGDGQQENGGYTIFHEFRNLTTETKVYTITLKTTSFYGCVSQTTNTIEVFPIPSPNFSVAPIIQTFPDATVNINSLVTPGPWTFEYNFGDGNISNLENPVHTYSLAGNYTITQKVSAGSCSDSISQTITIKPQPPQAGFNIPAAGCSPMQIQFENTSLYATSYLWDFGDGGISTKKDPFYTYFTEGTYAVSLTVTGPGGSSTFKADITVWATPNIFFNLAPDSVYVNDKPVKFFNYSSDATNYQWDFGDVDEETGAVSSSNTSSEYEPVHIYESIGWKDVMLIAWNDNCRDTLLKDNAVYVSPAGGLRFPNVFRPNPNGPSGGYYDPDDPASKNQVFFPGLIDQVLEYNLYIYNRWGELVFYSDEVNIGWDGYIKGRLARQGVYIWKVKGKYTNGKNFVDTGDVTLLH